MYKNEKSKKYHEEYRDKNRKSIQDKAKKYIEENPWMNSFYNAKQRCNNPNNQDYYNYGEKGIKFLITKEEMKILWFRDKAYNLKQHSIDRIDNKGNYTFDNCQFIEIGENSQKDKIIPEVYQYSKDNIFIKQWKSQAIASRELKIQQSDISKCIHKVIPSAGGFIWKQIKT